MPRQKMRGLHINMMKCSTLRQGCIEIGPPQASCSRDCRARSFHITTPYESDVQRVRKERRHIPDPLNSFRLRHVERDLSVRDRTWTNASGHLWMLWPQFELGFSDVVMYTLVPLGVMALKGELPRNIAISGIKYAGIFDAVRARPNQTLCTFERQNDHIPRCQSACYRGIHICQAQRVYGRRAYDGMAFLDSYLGLPMPYPRTSSTDPMHVVIGRRNNRRYITNVDELIRSCTGATIQGVRVICTGHNAALHSTLETAAFMRIADVYVTMHGGDCSNGLHLRPGSAMIEVVNNGFQHARTNWLDQYRMQLEPTVRVHRIVLTNQPMAAARIAWNRDGYLPWSQLHGTLSLIKKEMH